MITTEIGGRFGARVTEFREGSEAQGWSSERQEEGFLGFMEGIELGILRLLDGQTLFAEIREGVISIGEKTVDIPNSSIFADSATLIAHMSNRNGLLIEELEV